MNEENDDSVHLQGSLIHEKYSYRRTGRFLYTNIFYKGNKL